MLDNIIKYAPRMWKAITAAVVAGSGAFGALQVDGMTWAEWGYLAGVVAAALYATWQVPNADEAGAEDLSADVEGTRWSDPSTEPPF